MLFKNYKLWIKLISISPLILIFLFLNLFFKIKIGRIESRLFGHLLIQIELFLCEKENKYLEDIIVVWFNDKYVSNNFVLKKWRTKLFVLPRHILEPMYVFFSSFKFLNNYLYTVAEKNSSNQSIIKAGRQVDKYKLLQKSKPFINFSDSEKNLANKQLSKLGINEKDKIVCFSARSKHFRYENYNVSRNSEINNQLKGIKYLADLNFKCLRMGKNEKNKLNFTDKNVIDLAFSDIRNDMLDLFVASKCEFFISSSSGIDEMATIMRKKKMLIDFMHFDGMPLLNLDMIPIILPKRIKNLNNKKFLSYSEIFDFEWSYINTINDNKDSKHDLIDNCENEISNSIINMHKFSINKLNFAEERNFQNTFWEKLNKRYELQSENTIICPNFFRDNISLF